MKNPKPSFLSFKGRIKFSCWKKGDGGLVAKSCLTLVIPWTVACQASLSMGFPRQEYWNGLPFPFTGDLLDPGIKQASSALAGGFFTTEL